MQKFLADAMLKKLAEWLRILGVYCEYDYSRGKPDSRIISYVKRHNLVLLTRDAKMLPSLRKRKAEFLLINSVDIGEQIAQVFCNYSYKITFPKNTRCPKCNGTFQIAGKVSRTEAPPDVYRRKRKFWICRKCGKIYWKGGHWKNMFRTVARARGIIAHYKIR